MLDAFIGLSLVIGMGDLVVANSLQLLRISLALGLGLPSIAHDALNRRSSNSVADQGFGDHHPIHVTAGCGLAIRWVDRRETQIPK